MATTEAETLLDRYADMVLRIALHNVDPADAEDVVQEVFLRRITARRAFDSPEHEKAWMIRVTLNLCRDFLKSAHRRRDVPLEEDLPCENPDTEVLDAVLRLPVPYRNVIYLHYFEDLSVAEIARILHRRENTVSSRLHRARETLRTSLTGGFDDE